MARLLALLLAALTSLAWAAGVPRGPDWDEILGPPKGTWPTPQAEVVWRTDLRAALAEARQSQRPLFVTARCLPCKQCADFDQSVLDGGGLLEELVARFITVRITDAAQLDLARLPALDHQDFDLSWWGYFLSDRAELYGVYGGRDEVSDSTRISVASLANTLPRILDHHSDPRRAQWGIDGPAVPAERPARSPRDLPGHKAWLASNRWAQKQDCLHCHQIAEAQHHRQLAAGDFDKARAVEIWPLPENVGLQLDRDHGLLVTQVTPDSPAAHAGLRAGDVLGAAAGQRLFGQADFRGVLHREARPAGQVPVQWLRDGKRHTGVLKLADGWRRTVLDWRMSISQGALGADPGFFPLAGRRPDGAADRMAVRPYWGPEPQRSPAYRAGLRPHHTILAVDGQSPAKHGRAFLVWFRLRYDFGDTVRLSVDERGTERVIEVQLAPRD